MNRHLNMGAKLFFAAALLSVNASYAAEFVLQIKNATGNTLSLGIDDLKRLPQQTVKVDEQAGVTEYQGVALHEVIKAAGAPVGKEIRGAALKQYVQVRAVDNYQVVFALVETDPFFSGNVILLCHQKNGQLLPAEEGPLRLVVPADKRHARWIRQITRIEIRQAD